MNQKYTVQKKSIYYNVGRYRLDNRQDAQHLCDTLNQLTETQNTSTDTDKKLDTIQKKVIQLQMSISIIADELEQLHKEVIR